MQIDRLGSRAAEINRAGYPKSPAHGPKRHVLAWNKATDEVLAKQSHRWDL